MQNYAKSIPHIFDSVQSSKSGLSHKEVQRRQKESGKNQLPQASAAVSRLRIFLDQFASPLIIILVIAGVVSGLVGEIVDMIVILITVALNTVVGFFQEDKANNAVEELRSMVEHYCVVTRDGVKEKIKTEDLVVGDIVSIEAGDQVPADGRIIEAIDVHVDESSLTGESSAIEKTASVLKGTHATADQKNMLFRSTVVLGGRAEMVVTAIGRATEIGKIASLVKDTEEDKTPLQLQLSEMSRVIGIVVVGISIGIVLLGLLLPTIHESFVELFEIAVVLAVAAIPEGLVITLTVILAVGMRHILKRKALVRRLVAAETLGSITVICTDKTGTITEGKMRVSRVTTPDIDLDYEQLKTYNPKSKKSDQSAAALLGVAFSASDIIELVSDDGSTRFSGDAADIAIGNLYQDMGLYHPEHEKQYPRIAEIPFTSENKYIAALRRFDTVASVCVKGAPEVILARCTEYKEAGKDKKLTKKRREFFEEECSKLTRAGLRVLAVASKDTTEHQKNLSEADVEGLTFNGFLAFSDPIRPDVVETVRIAKGAGIRTIMITGDHVKTAQSIAEHIGLPADLDSIFDGNTLNTISDKELRFAVGSAHIFARVDPVHKIRIVRALQAEGEVVAMTGDGVNDAPALKAADIGVALGSGTAVAKETADIVLLDDAYKTIVAAIGEGRGIYQNIKKVVLYLLSGSSAEIVLVLGSLLSGMPIAILPTQILWINIIEDTFPNMTLAFDEGERENMTDPPRKKSDPIIDREMKIMIAIITVVSNLILLSLFFYFYRTTGDIALTRTIMFVGLGIDSLLYIYSVRSMRKHVWSMNPFNNKYLNFALLFGWAMLVCAIYVPVLQVLLHTVPLSGFYWIVMIIFGLINVFFIEVIKSFFFRRHNI